MIEAILSYRSVFDNVCVNVILTFSIYVTLTAGMFALANIGFMAIGAYVSALLTTRLGLPFGVANLAALVVAFAAASGLGAPVLKLRGDYLAVATIAFGELVRTIVLNAESVTGGALGLNNVPQYTSTWMLVGCVAALAVLFSVVRRTAVGTAIRAIRDDELVTSSFGVDVTRYRLVIFVFSAVVAAEAGVLSAHLNNFISPHEFTFHREVQVLAFAIFGGIGDWVGAVLGAGILTLLPEVLREIGTYGEFVIGFVIIGTIMYRPYGLYSVLEGFVERLRYGRRRYRVRPEEGAAVPPR